MPNESELLAELKRLRAENSRLRGEPVGGWRKRYIGPLTTQLKHTKWKRASQKTLVELLISGKLGASRIEEMIKQDPRRIKKVFEKAMAEADLRTDAGKKQLREMIERYVDLL